MQQTSRVFDCYHFAIVGGRFLAHTSSFIYSAVPSLNSGLCLAKDGRAYTNKSLFTFCAFLSAPHDICHRRLLSNWWTLIGVISKDIRACYTSIEWLSGLIISNLPRIQTICLFNFVYVVRIMKLWKRNDHKLSSWVMKLWIIIEVFVQSHFKSSFSVSILAGSLVKL